MEPTLMDHLGKWSPLILGLLQVVGLWVIWSLRRQFMTREDCSQQCKKLADKQTAQEAKQAALEAAHQSMPSAEDLERIQERLGGIEGEMKGMSATLKGQAEIMVRIERPLNLLLEHHVKREP